MALSLSRLRYGLAPPDNVRADLGVGWVYICIKARVAIPNPNHVRGVTVIQHKIFKVRPKLGLLFTVSFKGIHCTGSVYINDRNGVRESGNSKDTYAGGMWLKVSDMRPKGGRNEEAPRHDVWRSVIQTSKSPNRFLTKCERILL